MSILIPQPRRWTRQEYYRLADQGYFQDQRVELIEGQIVEMTPQKSLHAAAIGLVDDAIRMAFTSPGFWIRIQLPLIVSELSEPEPDIAVVRGRPRDFEDHHPHTAVLVVEVSNESLALDRGRKSALYAQASVPEYWIVNLPDHRLEVHRQPIRDDDVPGGHCYSEQRVLTSAESIAPLAAPDAPIRVADLLP